MLPYNPDSVALIKAMAPLRAAPWIAAALRWDIDMLRRVARRHAIELSAANPSDAGERLAQIRLQRIATRRDGEGKRFGKLDYVPGMTIEDVIARLPLRQAEMFRVLSRSQGRNLQLAEAAELLNFKGDADTLRDPIRALRAKLKIANARWQVESFKGRGGGYRLVESDQTTGSGRG